jgi:hypothetical protein
MRLGRSADRGDYSIGLSRNLNDWRTAENSTILSVGLRILSLLVSAGRNFKPVRVFDNPLIHSGIKDLIEKIQRRPRETISSSLVNMKETWQEVVAAKLATRDVVIQNHCHNSSVVLEYITRPADVKELTQRIRSGHFSTEDVVHGYISQ